MEKTDSNKVVLTCAPRYVPPTIHPHTLKKKKRNKLRVTELRLNGRALRTASPSPSQLSRRQWHTPALLLFEGTSSFQSAALQLCDSAAPSPRRCTPLLPRPPLPAHAGPAPPSRPIPFPSTLPRPECVQSRPAHLTLGRGLPAFAARLPGSVQTTKDTHRLSTGRNSLTGEATRRRRDVSPQATGNAAAILLCCAGCPEVPPVWAGLVLTTPPTRTGGRGRGASRHPFRLYANWTLGARLPGVNLAGCGQPSGRRVCEERFPTEAMVNAYVPLPNATAGGTSMEVFTAFGPGMMEGRP